MSMLKLMAWLSWLGPHFADAFPLACLQKRQLTISPFFGSRMFWTTCMLLRFKCWTDQGPHMTGACMHCYSSVNFLRDQAYMKPFQQDQALSAGCRIKRKTSYTSCSKSLIIVGHSLYIKIARLCCRAGAALDLISRQVISQMLVCCKHVVINACEVVHPVLLFTLAMSFPIYLAHTWHQCDVFCATHLAIYLQHVL